LTVSLVTILGVLAWLQVKHFVCDYPLQTRFQLINKGTYGHPGGLLHSGIHVAGTALVFVAVTPPLWVALAIMVGEFLAHYHLDWTKSRLMRATGWKMDYSPFWWSIGADQLGHHLTYIAIAAVLATTAA